MGRVPVDGEVFVASIRNLGEEVEFLTDPVINQYASIVAYRATGTTNMTDGTYQYRGAMTFDSVEQQDKLIGEYFRRQTNKTPVYFVASILPENTTPHLGSVYCVECNDKVDIISHYVDGERDEFGEPTKEPVYVAKDVDCYITVTQKQLTEAQAGAIVETVTNLLLPAKYLVSQNNTVLKKVPVFDTELKKNVLKDVAYRVDSIDTSLMDILQKEVTVENEDGEEETQIVEKYVGILRCFLKEAV